MAKRRKNCSGFQAVEEEPRIIVGGKIRGMDFPATMVCETEMKRGTSELRRFEVPYQKTLLSYR